MALSHQFPSAAAATERAERAFRMPLGVVSPLWAMFGAAAGAGVAYWWMTRWTRAVNFEAMAPFAPKLATESTPVEIVAEPEPEAVVAVEAALETASEPAPTLAPEPAARAPEPVVAEAAPALVEAVADDLTRMTGIGPKLSIALAELGVTRFAQIAAWTANDLAEMDAALSLKGRAVREAWVAQAKRLVAAK